MRHWTGTRRTDAYPSYALDGKTPTYGGYSNQMVVDENFVLRIPAPLRPAEAAPLLCAGITVVLVP
jgi:uncharacterized zinc-type alcohol dehydrogenase-like protein